VASYPTVDLAFAKLSARYPTAGRSMRDLMTVYWGDPVYGMNNGIAKGGDAYWQHWGGEAKSLVDRQYDYWLNRFPPPGLPPGFVP
jgi:hypothetical protein